MIIVMKNKLYNIRDGYIILSTITFILFVVILAVNHTQNTNEWYDDTGVVIDKYTTNDIIYCLIDVNGERHVENFGCIDKIVGDNVNVHMRKNLENHNTYVESIK